MSSSIENNKLYIVPTPIGNLEDITLRAIKVLEQVDLILAEDTRTSGVLCKHYNIQSPLQAYHKDNEHKVVQNIIYQIQSGKKIALISDAGTPGISDPGFLLTRQCLENNIEVECLPGATALIPALVSSGFPCDKFVFEGFLPHQKGRQKRLTTLVDEMRTIIFYESPYRIIKLMQELIEYVGGERKIAISRELTKKFEEIYRGTVTGALEHFLKKAPKGEFVVVLKGKEKD